MRHRFIAGAYLLTAIGVLVAAGRISAEDISTALPVLAVTAADLQPVGSNQYQLAVFVVPRNGAVVDDFSLRVERRPPGPVEIPAFDLPGPALPGFHRHRSRYEDQPVVLEFLNGGTEETPDHRMADNGALDEDPRDGVFAYTFDTEDWMEGEYVFQVSVSGHGPEGDPVQRDRRFVSLLLGDARPAASRVNVPEAVHRVIYKRQGIYAAFPRLHILPDGRMALSHATRIYRSHIDPTGGSAQIVTPDEGRTWEPLDEPLIDRSWITDDGRVLLPESEGWIFVDASREEELRAAGKQVHGRPTEDGRIAYRGGARVRVSTDGGRTWESLPVAMPDDPPVSLSGYSTAAACLVTTNGVRMRVLSGSRRHPDDPQQKLPSELFLLRSEDDGHTWTCRPMRPEGLPEDCPGLNETALVQTRSGRILAMCRSHGSTGGESSASRDGYLWQAESMDEGLTWTGPVRTKIRGYPAHVLSLDDGTLICAYGYRRDPMGIRAVLSYDEGRTWDMEHELILRADGLGHPGDNGMPLLHQLSDGSLIAIYYITTADGITHIASTTFRLPE